MPSDVVQLLTTQPAHVRAAERARNVITALALDDWTFALSIGAGASVPCNVLGGCSARFPLVILTALIHWVCVAVLEAEDALTLRARHLIRSILFLELCGTAVRTPAGIRPSAHRHVLTFEHKLLRHLQGTELVGLEPVAASTLADHGWAGRNLSSVAVERMLTVLMQAALAERMSTSKRTEQPRHRLKADRAGAEITMDAHRDRCRVLSLGLAAVITLDEHFSREPNWRDLKSLP